MKIFSLRTWLYAAYIIISASFMRHVVDAVKSVVAERGVTTIIWFLFFVTSVFLVHYVWVHLVKSRRYFNMLLLVVLLAGVVYYASTFHIMIERVHLVIFGLLGYSVATDNKKRPWIALLGAWIFCVLIVTADEVFQYFLPYRYCDIRDIAFGATGSAWGIAIQVASSRTFFKTRKRHLEKWSFERLE